MLLRFFFPEANVADVKLALSNDVAYADAVDVSADVSRRRVRRFA